MANKKRPPATAQAPGRRPGWGPRPSSQHRINTRWSQCRPHGHGNGIGAGGTGGSHSRSGPRRSRSTYSGGHRDDGWGNWPSPPPQRPRFSPPASSSEPWATSRPADLQRGGNVCWLQKKGSPYQRARCRRRAVPARSRRPGFPPASAAPECRHRLSARKAAIRNSWMPLPHISASLHRH